MPQISISDVTGIRIDRNADHELELDVVLVHGTMTLTLKPEDPGEVPDMLKRLAADCGETATDAQAQLDSEQLTDRLHSYRLAAAETVPTEDVSIAGVEVAQ